MTANRGSCSVPFAAKATCLLREILIGMFDSVRLRLTAWYVAVLTLTLVAFSLGVYIFLEHSFYDRLDRGLGSPLETLSAAVERHAASGETPRQAVELAVQELRFSNQTIAILDAEGKPLA